MYKNIKIKQVVKESLGGRGVVPPPRGPKKITLNFWFQVEGGDEEDAEEAMLADNQEYEIQIIKSILNKVAPGRIKVDGWDWADNWGTTYMGAFRGAPADLYKVWKALMKTPEIELTEPDHEDMFWELVHDE